MGRQVPRVRRGPRGRQVPSLTPGDTLCPYSRHVLMGRQGPMSHSVPKGRQEPRGR